MKMKTYKRYIFDNVLNPTGIVPWNEFEFNVLLIKELVSYWHWYSRKYIISILTIVLNFVVLRTLVELVQLIDYYLVVCCNIVKMISIAIIIILTIVVIMINLQIHLV